MSDVSADGMTASRAGGVAVADGQIPQPGRTRGSARQSAMLSSSRAGEVNRARVLKTLYANGPLARPELARLTGSTRATIGQIVQPFLDEGLLEEQAPLASGSRGGKRARPVWFSSAGWPVGAVLMLPEGAQAAVVTAGGEVTARAAIRVRPTKKNHDLIADRLTGLLREITANATSPLRGIGIAVAGMVDTQTGEIVRSDHAPGFNGLAVGPLVAQSLGVPAFVEMQPRAQALGDMLFGAGRGESSYCSLYVGEGIGAGFIFDGALHRGARGAGGEVGHTIIDRDGPRCECGLTGCWEALAATRWLRDEAAQRGLPQPKTIGAARLTALAPQNPAAAALLEDYAANIAVGIANLQQILGIGLFIVHGEPVGGGEALRSSIEDHVRRQAFAHPGGEPRVVFADPDDYATLRGAASIVLSRSLDVAF
jgi:predicted NBD/HSP70 family sugar kinase